MSLGVRRGVRSVQETRGDFRDSVRARAAWRHGRDVLIISIARRAGNDVCRGFQEALAKDRTVWTAENGKGEKTDKWTHHTQDLSKRFLHSDEDAVGPCAHISRIHRAQKRPRIRSWTSSSIPQILRRRFELQYPRTRVDLGIQARALKKTRRGIPREVSKLDGVDSERSAEAKISEWTSRQAFKLSRVRNLRECASVIGAIPITRNGAGRKSSTCLTNTYNRLS